MPNKKLYSDCRLFFPAPIPLSIIFLIAKASSKTAPKAAKNGSINANNEKNRAAMFSIVDTIGFPTPPVTTVDAPLVTTVAP